MKNEQNSRLTGNLKLEFVPLTKTSMRFKNYKFWFLRKTIYKLHTCEAQLV